MSSAEAMMMLIEVEHLEALELIRYSVDLLCLAFLDRFYALCIPDLG